MYHLFSLTLEKKCVGHLLRVIDFLIVMFVEVFIEFPSVDISKLLHG